MQGTDIEEFEIELRILADSYSKPLSDGLVRSYFNHLRKYHFETVRYILRNWTLNPAHHKKFPVPGEIVEVVKASSSKEYAKKSEEVHEIAKKIEVLESEFTLICKQICANSDAGNFVNHPLMRSLMQKDSRVIEQLRKDYSAYKTSLTNDELYFKQREISKKIADLHPGRVK